MRLKEAITFRRAPGPTISREGVTLTPWSRSVVVRLPFGGIVWNQAAAVEVTRDGRTEMLRIVDVGTRVRVALLVAAVVLAVATRTAARQVEKGKERMR
jgi:hypothetical protein